MLTEPEAQQICAPNPILHGVVDFEHHVAEYHATHMGIPMCAWMWLPDPERLTCPHGLTIDIGWLAHISGARKN